MAHHGGLLVELVDHLGGVVENLPEGLPGEGLGIGAGFLDRFGSSGHEGVTPAYGWPAANAGASSSATRGNRARGLPLGHTATSSGTRPILAVAAQWSCVREVLRTDATRRGRVACGPGAVRVPPARQLPAARPRTPPPRQTRTR